MSESKKDKDDNLIESDDLIFGENIIFDNNTITYYDSIGDDTYILNSGGTANTVYSGSVDYFYSSEWGDTLHDPFAELENIKVQQEKEEEMRHQNPVLKEAYEQYQLILKLVEDEEIDKSAEKRYEQYKK